MNFTVRVSFEKNTDRSNGFRDALIRGAWAIRVDRRNVWFMIGCFE